MLPLVCASLFAVCAQAAEPPTIVGFAPARAAVGDTVGIGGTNLATAYQATFSGGAVSTVYAPSSTLLVAMVPAGAQTGPVTVSTADGNASSPTDFVVEAAGPGASMSVIVPKVRAGSGGYGEFVVNLSKAATSDLFVIYAISGGAVNGTDYRLLKGVVRVKAGHTSKSIKIFPSGDLGGAHRKLVTLTLLPGDGYQTGTTVPESVKIVAP